MWVQRELGPAHQIKDRADPLGLRLRVAAQGCAKAPVVRTRSLREVDQTGKLRWLDLGRHGSAAYEPRGSVAEIAAIGRDEERPDPRLGLRSGRLVTRPELDHRHPRAWPR